MLKQIQLNLSKIQYVGDSVGDDIRIEIKCLDKFLSLTKKIKQGSEAQINKEIGVFYTSSLSFVLPANIKVIEEDLVFNDVNNKEIKLKINLSLDVPQLSVHKIEVQERRNFLSNKKAIFAITLEATASDAVLYATGGAKGGWVLAKREDTKELFSLPAYLEVRLQRQDAKRQYFKVLEGVLQGVTVSVKIESDGTSYLEKGEPHSAPERLTYSIANKILSLRNKTYKATDDRNAPWQKGLYDIEIPDAPHEGGKYYPESKYATVWFRIGHSGERYLHTGKFSAGCLTIVETKRWDEIYAVLIKARKGDGRSVGILEIID